MLAEDMRTTAHRAIEAAYNRGDMDGLDRLYSPGVLYHRPPLADIAGLDALKGYIDDLRSAFSEIRLTVHEIVVERELLASRWALRGTHTGQSPAMPVPPTGRELTVTGCSVAHCARGQVEEEWSHADWLGLFQQLNVVPPMG